MKTGIAVTRSPFVAMRSECEIWANGRGEWSGPLGKLSADNDCTTTNAPSIPGKFPHEGSIQNLEHKNAGQSPARPPGIGAAISQPWKCRRP